MHVGLINNNSISLTISLLGHHTNYFHIIAKKNYVVNRFVIKIIKQYDAEWDLDLVVIKHELLKRYNESLHDRNWKMEYG